MKSITRQRQTEQLDGELASWGKVYVAGCGTCATMTRTGGKDEVLKMKEHLEGLGKLVTGWIVIPVACDEMTQVVVQENRKAIQNADCILMMSCALGVQRMTDYVKKPVIPALDTLFLGVEDSPGVFHEACVQCGQCVLGETAGICPLAACHKGLLNGPCGGTNNGMCEVDRQKDCAWVLIYERLKEQDRLDMMHRYRPPKDYQVMPRPRKTKVA